METITTLLNNIKEVGTFCATRDLPIDKLQLSIKSVGNLNFPLDPKIVKELIKVATPAKFGWRFQTLLDLEIRNTWEISKLDITIINEELWEIELEAAMLLLTQDLGLPATVKLKPHLHNLLIYEPGQFFNYHQDSEKLAGMVATLIIILPSMHQGGTLIIDHKGSKQQFQSSCFSLDKLTLIGFYADCHHQVELLKEGYRLVLTYDLIMENEACLNSPNENSNKPLIQSLKDYFNEDLKDRDFKRYVYLLDHSYTQKGLSWDLLKNGDLLRANALKSAALELDLEIYMALADVQETWDCESDYDHYKYRRGKRKYSYYMNYDEDEEKQDLDLIQVNGLIDTSTVLQYWIDKANHQLPYKDCHISNKYIAWRKASNEFEPFDSEYEGFMGNYGNTLERWYHRAAIILWRKQDHYPILFEMDPDSVINELIVLANSLDNRAIVREIINSILPYWLRYLYLSRNDEIYVNIFNLALYVNDPKLAKAMIFDFNMKIINPRIVTLFCQLQELYGTSWCIEVLDNYSNKQGSSHIILKDLSGLVKILSNANDINLTAWFLSDQLNEIIKQHAYYQKQYKLKELIAGAPNRVNQIMDFMQACILVDNTSIYTKMLVQIMNNIELYPAIDLIRVILVLKNASQNIDKWSYQKLFNYVLNLLEQEKKLGLRKIDDWSINLNMPCNCDDCDTLRDFLQAKNLTTVKWGLNKERRGHINYIIDSLGISVSCQTERSSSPHKLILTKTEELHQAAKQRYLEVEKAIIGLLNLK